jgi:molecular chaperone GrpE
MAEDLKPEDGVEMPYAENTPNAAAAEEKSVEELSASHAEASSDKTRESEGASQPSAGEATTPAPSAESFVPLEKFEFLQREKQELYERLLRKQAEFENFRKRTEREKQDFYDFALANFIQGLLPILDGLERGLSVSEGETVEDYKKGIELILKQLRDQLASVGVQPIRARGVMFDPRLHQAVMREESSILPENEIIEEMQRGYTFKERLLRPSMVKVAVPVQVQDTENIPEVVSEAADEAKNQEPVQ